MFRSILVPLDGTAQSAEALPLAETIAQRTNGNIHVLTVPVPGDPPAEIVRYARSHSADLIVMVAHAVGPRSILALTSIAQQVVAHSPCPILLLRAGDRRPDDIRTLLVPVDGTPGGSLALAAARALTGAGKSRFVLLHVVVPVSHAAFAALPSTTVGSYVDPVWEDLARNASQMYLDALARRLRLAGVECDVQIQTGDVSREIVRCAGDVDADVVVMSTHSVTWPARAYVGSVADSVLRHGTRPVLLVQREPPAAEAATDGATGTRAEVATGR
jgi:nucleotide-binding universal stress UspA family protein